MTERKYRAAGAEKLGRLFPCRGRWGVSPTKGVALAAFHFSWASPTPGTLCGGVTIAEQRVQEEGYKSFFFFSLKTRILYFRASWYP